MTASNHEIRVVSGGFFGSDWRSVTTTSVDVDYTSNTGDAVVILDAHRSFEDAYAALVEQELAIQCETRSEKLESAEESAEMAPVPGGVQYNVAISVGFQRTLVVPEVVGGVARFSFDSLCG